MHYLRELVFCVVKSLPWIILFTMQAFVSSGTNFTLQFPKGEDGTVPKDHLDFDREPGKVRNTIIFEFNLREE